MKVVYLHKYRTTTEFRDILLTDYWTNLYLIQQHFSFSYMIYLLTAVGLTPGGRCTIHICKKNNS